MAMETAALARACGKSSVHNLEPNDLVALTVEAAAMAQVPLAGTDWIPRPRPEGGTLERSEMLRSLARRQARLDLSRRAARSGVFTRRSVVPRPIVSKLKHCPLCLKRSAPRVGQRWHRAPQRSVHMSDLEAQLRARAESDGVEFFFAMFVDMHGKPCAKMIPVEALDVLTGGGAGFAGLRGRADGADARRPRHDRRPGSRPRTRSRRGSRAWPCCSATSTSRASPGPTPRG